MIERYQKPHIEKLLANFPAVAIVGPRQCGKSTLAREIVAKHPNSILLDLENPDDRARLSEPTLYLSQFSDSLVCLDEVQFMPDIFNVLRSLIDHSGRDGQFLLLGSASPELLRQSAETLAGRIAYVELSPFSIREIDTANEDSTQLLWLRGGFPRSFLAKDEEVSSIWRKNFIRTFLERDLSLFGVNVPPENMRRLWMMYAHLHGQPLNLSALGSSLGVSHTTVRSHTDLLAGTFMLRMVEPLHQNIEKRIRKAPKVYLADSGILHALLDIESMDDLLSHPVAGFSWEGFVLQHILASLPEWKVTHITTSNQSEIDFILSKGQRKVAVECKLSRSPKLSRGFHTLMTDLKISTGFVVCPINDSFPLSESTIAIGLKPLISTLQHKY